MQMESVEASRHWRYDRSRQAMMDHPEQRIEYWEKMK